MDATDFNLPPNATLPSFFSSEDSSTIDNEEQSDVWWMLLWGSALVLFVTLPFCSNQHRRRLCMQRIREGRWIPDNGGEWSRDAVQRQERRQQLEEAQERFRTSKTQEDDIREQFMLFLMEKFTHTLAEGDIHEDEKLVRSLSQRSLGTRSSSHKSLKDISNSSIEATAGVSLDVESPAEPDTVTPSSTDGCVSDEEDEVLVAIDFHDTNQVVALPLAGQERGVLESSGPSSLRYVPNGCTICLSNCEPGENITWSSNPECAHIFHSECILHWFHSVGRKAQRKLLRRNPKLSGSDVLDLICKFPMLCPCCRQPFCLEKQESIDSKTRDESNNSLDGDIENQLAATESSTSLSTTNDGAAESNPTA